MSQIPMNFDDETGPSEDHDDLQPTSSEPTVYTISEINSLIRGQLESRFQKIWIRGEISNFKPHSSGHYYFSLKDDSSQISAVMFRGLNGKLKFRPENGLEVLIRGKITVYEPRGQYQLFCETMEPVGAGALQKAFEQLKAKLEKEGLFAADKKRPMPSFPRHIGLVTSPTGAAIRDMLNVLRRRNRGVRITLAPALVQGDPAPASIVAALNLMNQVKDVDVIIVGRGGGSIEDLWAFNSEEVARAIANSRVPIISAVGHEVDFTISDFVADLRAPTPSAAAELVVKNVAEILERVQDLKQRLWQAWRTQVRSLTETIQNFTKRLVDPKRKLQDLSLRCDELSTRLENAMFRFIEDRRLLVRLAFQKIPTPQNMILNLQKKLQMQSSRLESSIQRTLQRLQAKLSERMSGLDAMSPLRVVERGYSIVEKVEIAKARAGAKGEPKLNSAQIISDSRDVKVGDSLRIRLAKGALGVEVKNIESI